MVPVSLEIKNFFSHRDSTVDFSQFDSALLIGNVEGNYDISNGSGKSAVFESILWCLFNKARVASMDDVIFWGESNCRVTFTFKHGGETYRVVRKRQRSGSTSNVEFLKQDANNNWVDISGSTPSLTNDEIVKAIKFDYKTFINSAYFRQNDISEFTETDASRKKEILKSIMDISKWDEYEEKIKFSLKELRAESKLLESKIEDYDKNVVELESLNLLLNNESSNLEAQLKSRDELDHVLQSLNTRYQELKSSLDTAKWDQTVALLEGIRKDYDKANRLFKSNQDNLKKHQDNLATKAEEAKEFNSKIDGLIIIEDAEERLTALSQEAIEYKAKMEISKQLGKAVAERKIAKDSCYVCSQAIHDELYNHLLNEQKKQLDEYKSTFIYCQNKVKEVEEKILNLEVAKNNKRKKEVYLSKIKTLEAESKISEERVLELTTDNSHLEKELLKLTAEISANESILESLKDDSFKELQKNIANKKEEKAELSKSIEKNNHNIGVLTEKISNVGNKISEGEETKKKFLEKQKSISTLEKMVKLLGKNGIQTILLNALIEDLEKTSNEILNSICNEPFQIFLDTQRVGSDGVSVVDTLDLRVKKEGVVQNFKSLSGGEKFRISLALRIALSEISSRHGGSSLEFLLLDEINSPLDRQGTESLFVNVIKALEKKYKILVITHNDSLKERFNNILDITKVNGESSINYIAL
jgi:exonuclease SbcC